MATAIAIPGEITMNIQSKKNLCSSKQAGSRVSGSKYRESNIGSRKHAVAIAHSLPPAGCSRGQIERLLRKFTPMFSNPKARRVGSSFRKSSTFAWRDMVRCNPEDEDGRAFGRTDWWARTVCS